MSNKVILLRVKIVFNSNEVAEAGDVILRFSYRKIDVS